jgi:DNA-binding ferritin-like protein
MYMTNPGRARITRKNGGAKNNTRKAGKKMTGNKGNKGRNRLTKAVMNGISSQFMEMLATVKLYHWKTMYLSVHLASDDLYASLNTKLDRFMEVLIGKTNYNIDKLCFKCFSVETKHHFVQTIDGYVEYLRGLSDIFHDNSDSELISIRDEIIGDLLQLIYLMRLK